MPILAEEVSLYPESLLEQAPTARWSFGATALCALAGG